MSEPKIHKRISERHPELTDQDVLCAWRNAVEVALRITSEKDFTVAVGFDSHGRMLEMVAIEENGEFLIFHAMTPPSRKTLEELNLIRR